MNQVINTQLTLVRNGVTHHFDATVLFDPIAPHVELRSPHHDQTLEALRGLPPDCLRLVVSGGGILELIAATPDLAGASAEVGKINLYFDEARLSFASNPPRRFVFDLTNLAFGGNGQLEKREFGGSHAVEILRATVGDRALLLEKVYRHREKTDALAASRAMGVTASLQLDAANFPSLDAALAFARELCLLLGFATGNLVSVVHASAIEANGRAVERRSFRCTECPFLAGPSPFMPRPGELELFLAEAHPRLGAAERDFGFSGLLPGWISLGLNPFDEVRLEVALALLRTLAARLEEAGEARHAQKPLRRLLAHLGEGASPEFLALVEESEARGRLPDLSPTRRKSAVAEARLLLARIGLRLLGATLTLKEKEPAQGDLNRADRDPLDRDPLG